MTGYQSKKDMAQDKLAQPAQEPVLGEWTPCMKLPVVVHVRKQRPGEAHVSTREGITPVKPDDLIMRGVSGEEYPIGRAIFEQTYSLDTNPPAAQPVGQAPCVRHCESTAYEIVIRGLKGDIERLKAAQPEQERNFCSRCGKRTKDLTVIHTCTPPRENT